MGLVDLPWDPKVPERGRTTCIPVDGTSGHPRDSSFFFVGHTDIPNTQWTVYGKVGHHWEYELGILYRVVPRK